MLTGESTRAPGLTLPTLYVMSESSLSLGCHMYWGMPALSHCGVVEDGFSGWGAGRNCGDLPYYQHYYNTSLNCCHTHTARAGLMHGLQPSYTSQCRMN